MTTGEKVLAKGIINIQDEITKTRETTDRILKIVSESNNTKSKQNPDNDLSDFIYKCLDRAGFREPTMYEFDIKDMLKAFEDTSCALSTGILKDREGNTILEYHGSTTFSDNSLSNFSFESEVSYFESSINLSQILPSLFFII